MKTKKVIVLIASIAIILSLGTTQVMGWVAKDTTFEACNGINAIISNIMKIIAFIIGVSYITVADIYRRYSKDEKEKKKSNISKWFAITLTQILVLACGAIWVKEVGMETYWYATGLRVQVSDMSGYVASIMRIVALILIIFYAVLSSIYYFKSQKESDEKLRNIIKYQIYTSVIVVVLLLCARAW